MAQRGLPCDLFGQAAGLETMTTTETIELTTETTEQMAMAARETTTEITTEMMTVETTEMNTTEITPEITEAVTPPKIYQKLAMQRSPPGTAPREPQQTNRKNRLPAMAGDGGGRPPGRPPD